MKKWQKQGISSIVAATMIGSASMTVSAAESEDLDEIQQEVNVSEEEAVSAGSETEEKSNEVEVHAPNK
ncbi:hypothetical protein, partial [Bhargavaea cecembensis]|uniref:hypothetical protein n=1 Tax=Bhargavaea cecembensis TaxID=394098 RepID=UPI0012E8F710